MRERERELRREREKRNARFCEFDDRDDSKLEKEKNFSIRIPERELSRVPFFLAFWSVARVEWCFVSLTCTFIFLYSSMDDMIRYKHTCKYVSRVRNLIWSEFSNLTNLGFQFFWAAEGLFGRTTNASNNNKLTN